MAEGSCVVSLSNIVAVATLESIKRENNDFEWCEENYVSEEECSDRKCVYNFFFTKKNIVVVFSVSVLHWIFSVIIWFWLSVLDYFN